MEIRVAIVDDRAADRAALAEAVRRFAASRAGARLAVDAFASAEQLLAAFEPARFQIAFLDICMDEMNGIELARTLRAADARLLIVFQTTSREYAFDAFPIHPFDYLVKPYGQPEIDRVLQEAMRALKADTAQVAVATVQGDMKVPLRSLSAVESRGHAVALHLADASTLTARETFRAVSEKLAGDARFLLINRGLLVNMDHVRAPRDGSMHMKNGESFPIKVNGRAQVLAAFSQYMLSRVEEGGTR